MAETKRTRQRGRAAYWQGHLDRCTEQGLALAAYARANGLPVWQLYQWKARLRCDSESVRRDTPLFQTVQVVQSALAEPMPWRVRFPNGVTVECGPLDAEEWSVLLREVRAL